MSVNRLRSYPLVATVALLAAAGCSDVSLVCTSADCKPATPAPGVDNKLEASGQACTANPGSVDYLYKILFIIDVSGSTGPEDGGPGSDPTNGRGRAVQQVFDTYGSNPLVSYAIITFDTEPILTQPTFIRDMNVLEADIPAVDAHLYWTNYVDTLIAAEQLILADANTMSPVERSRTRYDIEFLSDGTPTASDTYCQSQNSVLAAESTLLNGVEALGVLSVKLSTIFLTGPDPDDSACDATPVSTLSSMATEGGGTYQALSGNAIAFDISYTTILEPFARNNFYVVNQSRVVHNGKLYPDSDGDGVSDVDEVTLGTDPTIPDTYHTGCGDRVVQLEGTANPNLCALSCAQAMTSAGDVNSLVDTDVDGMYDCVESAQSTNGEKADSDGDNLVDLLETRFGTNPMDPRTLTADTDLDGVIDADEVLEGTDPLTPEPDRSLAYVYTPLTSVPATQNGTSCFQFDISNIQLVQTVATPTTKAGDNVICLYVEQLPQSTSSADSEVTLSKYCETVNYTVVNGVSVKIPASGQISLSPNDFTPVICGSSACNPTSD